ncbi:MAG: hypothetical protein MJE68_03575 [Proteobacteria bacterium]|nr:hypothetical protein [Pseudomonadota bacterium]
MKLEELVNIRVLTGIEENAEKFVDTAGFKLVHSTRRKVRIACEYIEAWKKEKIIRCHKPTWRGLFTVLRQIRLSSLAASIDSILRETSPSIEQGVECEDPENGMYGCNCNIVDNIIFKQQWTCS